MRKVTLEKIKCYETEDWRTDECRLNIYVDEVLKPYLRKNMKEGRTWTLNKSYTYKNKVRVRLYDEDSPDADDFLGQVTIDLDLENHATGKFTRDGAEYKLWYSVVDVPDADPVQEAMDRFRNSNVPGKWLFITKTDLLNDISRTISRPLYVNQGSTPLCGPAAIVYELVCKQPARYIDICKELYETGKFKGKTKTFEPSSALKRSRLRSANRISTADWMLMATLRDTANEVFDVTSDSNNFVMGISTPWEMKGWTSEVLGYGNVDWESTYVYGEFEAMRQAKRARDRGGVAFIMCHSAMVGGSSATIDYPNHWITYDSRLHIDEGVWYRHDSGHIKFRSYTWGRLVDVDLDEGKFEDCMFGVVTGKA